MNNENIIIIANTSWYIYNFRLSTIRVLSDLGHKVTIVCGDDKYINKIKHFCSDVIVLKLHSDSASPVASVFVVWKIFCLLKSKTGFLLTFNPKINFYVSIISPYLAVKWVPNVSGLGRAFQNIGLLKLALRFSLYMMAKQATAIMVQNERDHQLFTEQLSSKLKINILPGSGVNLSDYPYQKLNGLEEFDFCIVCRLIPEKGIDLLIEALQVLIDDGYVAKCAVAGPIPNSRVGIQTAKKIAVAEKEGFIKYFGVTDGSFEIIANSRCAVFPSSYAEGTPKFLLEAAAVGRVIITSDEPGCSRVIRENGGYVVRKGSVSDLVNALKEFLNQNLDTMQKMGEKNHNTIADHFSEEDAIKPYLDVLKNTKSELL